MAGYLIWGQDKTQPNALNSDVSSHTFSAQVTKGVNYVIVFTENFQWLYSFLNTAVKEKVKLWIFTRNSLLFQQNAQSVRFGYF